MPQLSVKLRPILRGTCKAASFNWGQKVYSTFRLKYKPSYCLILVFGPTDPRILEVTITSREAVCCIEEPLTSNREITIEEIYAIF